MIFRAAIATCAAALLLAPATSARAEQTLRVQVDQRGDFALIGNTMGWDCGAGAEPPVVGDIDEGLLPGVGLLGCGPFLGADELDTSPDLYWRSDTPDAGNAIASSWVDAQTARTTAVLNLPEGATVTHAFLYWGARRIGTIADLFVVIDRPNGPSLVAEAVDWNAVPQPGITAAYQAVADITSFVSAVGNGPFRVTGIDSVDFDSSVDDVLYAGWAMVVLYSLDSEPLRNLAVFDGFDAISFGESSAITLDGFLVPAGGHNAKLGTIAYEGDTGFDGDSLWFGTAPLSAADALSDAVNPANNFFNGTRSLLGSPVSVVGDLPQLTGSAGTMAGIDLDVVDVSSKVAPGQTRADMVATTNLDNFFLGAFITSVSTQRPDFVSSEKTVTDLNGGSVERGDTVEYTIVASNTGDDASIETVITDPLPDGVTYVPGSIEYVSGAGAGAKTDAAGDDEARYDAASNTVIANVGTGATASAGGRIAAGASVTVSFQVTIDDDAPQTILNQGTITSTGEQGAPETETPTDGNGDGPGAPPTPLNPGGDDPDNCASNADCPVNLPLCDTATNTCVDCLTDADCGGPSFVCMNNMCVCNGLDTVCQDTDGDGVTDMDELNDGTDPNDADSDDDGVPDGREPDRNADTDGDGLINALDPDSDDDGLFDGTELGYDCSNPGTEAGSTSCVPDGDGGATTTDPLVADTDGGGATDGSEDSNLDGKLDPGERDPTAGNGADDSQVVDSDGDGLGDDLEDTLGSDKDDSDSDDDGVPDGEEANPSDDTDDDGLNNVLDRDSDDDLLLDGIEVGSDCSDPGTGTTCIPDADGGQTVTSPVNADTDGGGESDGSEDMNLDGAIDPGERDPTAGHPEDDQTAVDTDGDGLSDDAEDTIGTDKNDSDSDDDGVPDGDEVNASDDTDGDGLINALDPDSDDDGLLDGTELGYDCSNAGTAPDQCVPDADPTTTTSAVDADTDGGGATDGSEDSNLNGRVDDGERDPTVGNAADDSQVVDTDGDGLGNDLEETLGSDPDDSDTDNDGVPDGEEANPSDDTDGDGLVNVLDPDSDDDLLLDGTEVGSDCSNPGTDATKCVPDADPTTTTSMVSDDTDGGGEIDGSEDENQNGALEDGERDPTKGHADDDNTGNDSDGDGLDDDTETQIGSDPNDADSDDDGVPDGDESNATTDTDGDGLINILDPDSDGDGLFDGTERGLGCDGAGTDSAAGTCVPDADPTTTTSMVSDDTDGGGLGDGEEDLNQNGRVDAGETDPNDPCDDSADACPDTTAGDGGVDGGDAGEGGVDGGVGADGGQQVSYDAIGGAPVCSAQPGSEGGYRWLALLVFAALTALVLRRRGASR